MRMASNAGAYALGDHADGRRGRLCLCSLEDDHRAERRTGRER
jgi:hypothetical protein